jgi:hypothetical protein
VRSWAVSSQCSSAVEQRFRKPSVAGSIPAIGSISNCECSTKLGRIASATAKMGFVKQLQDFKIFALNKNVMCCVEIDGFIFHGNERSPSRLLQFQNGLPFTRPTKKKRHHLSVPFGAFWCPQKGEKLTEAGRNPAKRRGCKKACKKARGSCVKPWSYLLDNSSSGGMVPTTGLEPVRCYPLEPESSASANSATWAR